MKDFSNPNSGNDGGMPAPWSEFKERLEAVDDAMREFDGMVRVLAGMHKDTVEDDGARALIAKLLAKIESLQPLFAPGRGKLGRRQLPRPVHKAFLTEYSQLYDLVMLACQIVETDDGIKSAPLREVLSSVRRHALIINPEHWGEL